MLILPSHRRFDLAPYFPNRSKRYASSAPLFLRTPVARRAARTVPCIGRFVNGCHPTDRNPRRGSTQRPQLCRSRRRHRLRASVPTRTPSKKRWLRPCIYEAEGDHPRRRIRGNRPGQPPLSQETCRHRGRSTPLCRKVDHKLCNLPQNKRHVEDTVAQAVPAANVWAV